MSVLNIRPVRSDDASFIARWHTHYFDNGWSTRSVLKTLNSPAADGVVALESGQPIGVMLW